MKPEEKKKDIKQPYPKKEQLPGARPAPASTPFNKPGQGPNHPKKG